MSGLGCGDKSKFLSRTPRESSRDTIREVKLANEQNIDEDLNSAKHRCLSRRRTLLNTQPVRHLSEDTRKLKSDQTGVRNIASCSIPLSRQLSRDESTLPSLYGTTPPANALEAPKSVTRSHTTCNPFPDVSNGFSLSKVSGLSGKIPLGRRNSYTSNSSRPREIHPVLARRVTFSLSSKSGTPDHTSLLETVKTEGERQQTPTKSFSLPEMGHQGSPASTKKAKEALELVEVETFNSAENRAVNGSESALGGQPTPLLSTQPRSFQYVNSGEIGRAKALAVKGTVFPIRSKEVAKKCRQQALAIRTHVEWENDNYDSIKTKAGILFEWLEEQAS